MGRRAEPAVRLFQTTHAPPPLLHPNPPPQNHHHRVGHCCCYQQEYENLRKPFPDCKCKFFEERDQDSCSLVTARAAWDTGYSALSTTVFACVSSLAPLSPQPHLYFCCTEPLLTARPGQAFHHRSLPVGNTTACPPNSRIGVSLPPVLTELQLCSDVGHRRAHGSGALSQLQKTACTKQS